MNFAFISIPSLEMTSISCSFDGSKSLLPSSETFALIEIFSFDNLFTILFASSICPSLFLFLLL